MHLIVNGDEQSIDAQTLEQLLLELDFDMDQGGYAVAVNDTVVPKNKFQDYELDENDHIEIIRATQGG
ncbi:MAG TPA: sulfur carrier protein ThiS [Balneolaceae bacterium]|nr:sulfur carrier protein ThiS [Balneolaceae bacterium]